MFSNVKIKDMSLDTRLSYQNVLMQVDDDSDNGGYDYGDILGVGDEGEFHSHSGNESIVEDDGDMNWEDILPYR
jgi:hypothetical protein